jgi:hypothetical protein
MPKLRHWVKSYETLVDSDTTVDVHTGIVAAGRLQSLMDSRDFPEEPGFSSRPR